MIVVPRPRHNSLLDRALAFGVRAASDVSDIEHRANMRMHQQLMAAKEREQGRTFRPNPNQKRR